MHVAVRFVRLSYHAPSPELFVNLDARTSTRFDGEARARLLLFD
jgi:hypothetical protein